MEILDRIRNWNTKEQGPYQIQLHLTNLCNLKCHFCPTRTFTKNKNPELTIPEWNTIIDDGNEIGVKEWHICGGGEPFFFANTAGSVIGRIKGYGRHCEIITNGSLFNDALIKNLVAIEVDKITFSVDGSNAMVHEKIRGAKCFDAIVNNLKLFNHWKKKMGKDKPYISFHTVLCNKNYTDIINIIKLAAEVDAQSVLVNALNIWSDDIKDYELNDTQKTELHEILDKAHTYAAHLKINTNIAEFMQLNLFDKANMMDESIYGNQKNISLSQVPCYIPWYNISIFSDGECRPCFILKQKGPSLKHESLREIWLGNYFNKTRDSMMENKKNSDCAKCNPWSFYKNKEIREHIWKST
jgi:MoaA/NifB/PqqE/SkfB family radical SAM enzyme